MGSKNGLIDSQEDVGGWPKLYSSKAPVDTDNDGIPDSWEEANDMDPNDASDANKYELSKNYTNLEVYLNSLVKDIMNGGLADGVASENEDYDDENDNGDVIPSTYTVFDFDKGSDSVTPGVTLDLGEHEYNGITIIASSANKVKVSTSLTFNQLSDEGTTIGGLQTGGSNSGLRVNGMKAGETLEIWVAPSGTVDAAKLRGVKITDGSNNTTSYLCQATDVQGQARKYTHTVEKTGNVTVLSEQSVNISRLRLGLATSINSSKADNTAVIISRDNISAEGACGIEIYSITGTLISSVKGDSSDISSFSKGAYIAKIILNDGSYFTHKFFKF